MQWCRSDQEFGNGYQALHQLSYILGPKETFYLLCGIMFYMIDLGFFINRVHLYVFEMWNY